MMTEDDTIAYNLVGHAVENLPMFISEWDAPWPNAYRADATLFLAAIGALQNWAGWTIHTYRYGIYVGLSAKALVYVCINHLTVSAIVSVVDVRACTISLYVVSLSGIERAAVDVIVLIFPVV